MVPDVEVVVLAEHVDVAVHRRRFAEPRRNEHTALRVELGPLTVVIHAIEKSQAGWMRRGHLSELLFDVGPDWHRIDPDVLARQARQKHVAAVFALQERTEYVRNLESPFVIDAGDLMPSKHETPSPSAHFCPQNSTENTRGGSGGCQPQNPAGQ